MSAHFEVQSSPIQLESSLYMYNYRAHKFICSNTIKELSDTAIMTAKWKKVGIRELSNSFKDKFN